MIVLDPHAVIMDRPCSCRLQITMALTCGGTSRQPMITLPGAGGTVGALPQTITLDCLGPQAQTMQIGTQIKCVHGTKHFSPHGQRGQRLRLLVLWSCLRSSRVPIRGRLRRRWRVLPILSLVARLCRWVIHVAQPDRCERVLCALRSPLHQMTTADGSMAEPPLTADPTKLCNLDDRGI